MAHHVTGGRCEETWSEPCESVESLILPSTAGPDKARDIYGIPAARIDTMETIDPDEDYL